jgi:hypothetical protein
MYIAPRQFSLRKKYKKYKPIAKFTRVGVKHRGVFVRAFLRKHWRVYVTRALIFIYNCLFHRRFLAWGAIFDVFVIALKQGDYSVNIYLTIFISWFFYVWRLAYLHVPYLLNTLPPYKPVVHFIYCFFGLA